MINDVNDDQDLYQSYSRKERVYDTDEGLKHRKSEQWLNDKRCE